MKGTAILITVSITFILFTSPATIVFSITNHPNHIVKAVTYVLMCMNHSINAVLYCIVGSRFRQEILRMLGCEKENISEKRCNRDLGLYKWLSNFQYYLFVHLTL